MIIFLIMLYLIIQAIITSTLYTILSVLETKYNDRFHFDILIPIQAFFIGLIPVFGFIIMLGTVFCIWKGIFNNFFKSKVDSLSDKVTEYIKKF